MEEQNKSTSRGVILQREKGKERNARNRTARRATSATRNKRERKKVHVCEESEGKRARRGAWDMQVCKKATGEK